jgi:hypothetical protein
MRAAAGVGTAGGGAGLSTWPLCSCICCWVVRWRYTGRHAGHF